MPGIHLVDKFDARDEIDFTLSIADVQKLKKDKKNRKFVFRTFIRRTIQPQTKKF